MFGIHDTRRHAADRIADSADDTSKKISAGTREARRRAGAAMAALAGRRQRTRWEWLAAATLAGVAAGWVATSVTRRAAATMR
jgi:hypothetical protein